MGRSVETELPQARYSYGGDEEVGDIQGFELHTRVVDVPVMMEDPWTHETLMRFRDRHQDPEATDLEYSARINGYDSKEDFIAALLGSPWLVTMIGFVPGLPWCYQLVPPGEQVEVPKYVRPRTYTPERAFGFGGGFAVVYSVEGAGGYQLYGLAPAPVLDVKQELKDFQGSIVFHTDRALEDPHAYNKEILGVLYGD